MTSGFKGADAQELYILSKTEGELLHLFGAPSLGLIKYAAWRTDLIGGELKFKDTITKKQTPSLRVCSLPSPVSLYF